MSAELITPLWLSLKLASVTTVILLLLCTPLAWQLAQTQRWWKSLCEALIALPLVLPSTVIGFYLLMLLGAQSPLGQTWQRLTGSTLAFSFSGLVIGSVFYSLPFVFQAIQTSFEDIDPLLLETATCLGASKHQLFLFIGLPLSRRGVLSGAVLGFAHTLGEFGIVLMLGGNIPGKTEVLSIAIYNHVEQIEYASANTLSLIMIAIAFCLLFCLFAINRRWS